MKATAVKFQTVEAYLSSFPKETKAILKAVRATIKKAAPKAEELISYNMPALKYHDILVYYAGYKNHIGFYPGASGIANFTKEIAGYKNSKGTVQFPLDKPLPLALIAQIVKFRIKDNLEKEERKLGKKNTI